MTDTATVEVLTAEVRVLMVGSRQITLSVVRQLDEVDPDLIEPFGRVRAARKPSNGQIEVVGSADGILAYSTAEMKRHDCWPNNLSYLCDEHTAVLREQGITGKDWTMRWYGGSTWAWKLHTWVEFEPSRDLYDRWADLPLIVLAGLR